jgi:hypothetical protein
MLLVMRPKALESYTRNTLPHARATASSKTIASVVPTSEMRCRADDGDIGSGTRAGFARSM